MPKDYTAVEDLLSDESFLTWHFGADTPSGLEWEEWIAADPAHRQLADEAAAFMQSLQIREKGVAAGDITRAESQLLNRIQEMNSLEKKRGVVAALRSGRGRWIAAASVVLVCGLSGLLYFQSKKSELKTAYGQIQESKLPDGSMVTVNADSRITFDRAGWAGGKDREVWLTGEAFFHVAKTPMKSRFIVHANHFDIIVTGTQFNVVSREDKSNVMLKEGSVILHNTESGSDIKMAPGDFVEYRRAGLEKKMAKTDSVLAWKDRKLVFDNTPVSELAKIIREHYGVTLIPADENVAEKTVTGIMPNDNLDVLLQTLEGTGNFKVTRGKDTVIISAP
jgi:transmembrane sensor